MTDVAVLVPVGPSEKELQRLDDLLDSIRVCEPEVRSLILIDDHETDRRLWERASALRKCTVVSLPNPRGRKGLPLYGGMFVGVLAGLAWIEKNHKPNFVVKLDTDSLVIRPFAAAVNNFFRKDPGTGVTGVLGSTCNRSSEHFRIQLHEPSPVIRRMVQLNMASTPGAEKNASAQIAKTEEVSALRSFESVFEAACRNGFHNNYYCQGGGYAISSEMLSRIASAGWLTPPSCWIDLPFAEDILISLLAYAVGMKLTDLSEEGDPFGVQWAGLPFSLDVLVARGYSIIHSVKNDLSYSEKEVRRFFSSLRVTRRPAPSAAATVVAQDGIRTNQGPCLYADSETAEFLAESSQTKVILAGGFIGSLNFGDIVQFRSVAESYKQSDFGATIALVSLQECLRTRCMKTAGRICNNARILFATIEPLPESFMNKFQLVTVKHIRGPKLLHFYGNRLLTSYEVGGGWLNVLEMVARWLSPDLYIISGQQLATTYMGAFIQHVRSHHPALVGCRYAETVSALRAAGIHADLSSHDALDYLDSIPAPAHSQMPSHTDRAVALQLGIPGYIFSNSEAIGPQLLESHLEKINMGLDTLCKFYPGPSAMLLVNSNQDLHDRHDTWSSLRWTNFGTAFSHFHCVDMVNLLLKDRLSELTAYNQNVDRFIGTALHPALLFRRIGVPIFLWSFNDYYRSTAAGIGQECETVEEFLAAPLEILCERQALQGQRERSARDEWTQKFSEVCAVYFGK